jgi:hypothetical protein
MRTNNNTNYESGNRRLGDFIDFANFGYIGVKIGIESISSGDSILVQYHFANGAQVFTSQDYLITEEADQYFSSANSNMGPDTVVNGSIHTNGRARYSVEIVVFEPGEEFPGIPHP